MRLIGDFIEILATSKTAKGFNTTVALNPDHIVYKSHFPGYPVTPGVVQLQIVHELLELHFNRKYHLSELLQCKFLKILDPYRTPQITIFIECHDLESELKIDAVAKIDGMVCFKLKSKYRN